MKFCVPRVASIALAVAALILRAANEPPAAVPALPPAGGRISFDETSFDFGQIEQGKEFTHDFVIRNKGTGLLTIQDAVSSCGCTVALPQSREIAVGSSSTIKVTFKSLSFSGPVAKTVTVRSNDAAQPAVTIDIRANVQPFYVIEPSVLNLGDIERGKGAERDVTVRQFKNQPFKIERLQVSHPDLKAAFTPIEGSNGSAYRIHVSLSSKRNAGPFSFSVIAVTDRLDIPHPMLILGGNIIGPVRVWPPAIFLGQSRGNVPFKPQTITVKNNAAHPVEIKSVDAGDPGLQTKVETVTPGVEYHIELSVKQMPQPGWFQRKMQILTSESDVPLEVTLSGVVLKPEPGAPLK